MPTTHLGPYLEPYHTPKKKKSHDIEFCSVTWIILKSPWDKDNLAWPTSHISIPHDPCSQPCLLAYGHNPITWLAIVLRKCLLTAIKE